MTDWADVTDEVITPEIDFAEDKLPEPTEEDKGKYS